MSSALGLVVEDDEKSRELLCEILTASGFRTLSCESGRECLQWLSLNVPNFILMDIHLPDMDGTAVLKTLRQDPRLRNVPVIAVTASVMPHQKATVLEAGFDAFVSKPIGIKVIVDTVNALLRRA